MKITRRHFLANCLSGAGLMLAPGAVWPANASRVLEAAPGRTQLEAGLDVPVWAYNQRVPGPEIRLRQGDVLDVRLKNRLQQATSIHWHGLRIDNSMDGVPGFTQDAVQAGEDFDYTFHLPDAGTFWYHSHFSSSEQSARGMQGLLVVEEPDSYSVDRELSLVIDDWRLNSDNVIEPSFGNLHDVSHAGRLGNYLTVNGVSSPVFPVSHGERLRLRLANTANARVMPLQFDNVRCWTIALDGQPVLPAPLDQGSLVLAPGQRADLVIDIEDDVNTNIPINFMHRQGTLPIAYFQVNGRMESPVNRNMPVPLPDNPLPTSLDYRNALRVELVMSGGTMGQMRSAIFEGRAMSIRELVTRGKAWSFNGIVGMTEEPLFRVKRGRTMFIDMWNETSWPHAMHVHGHHFKIIEKNDQKKSQSPWRDTTLMQVSDRISIGFVADNPGKWLLHCHMLEHMAGGMATWFEVI